MVIADISPQIMFFPCNGCRLPIHIVREMVSDGIGTLLLGGEFIHRERKEMVLFCMPESKGRGLGGRN